MKKEQNLENSTKQALTIPVVSGSISIEKNNDKGQLKIASKSNWFNTEYVIVNMDEDCIIISKPTLDYTGKMYKVLKVGLNNLVKLSLDLPMGKFDFDEEESTEDELVLYYR